MGASSVFSSRVSSLPHREDLAEFLFEELDGAGPRELGGGFVEAGSRVVMEAVIRAGIDEGLVFHLGGFQRGLPCGPAGVNAGVEFAEVKQERALDFGGVFGGIFGGVFGGQFG